jgi:hypothetical protein
MGEPFPVSGDIDPATFPQLVGDLHRRGATGSLKVQGPSYTKHLYFRGGRILFGSSNDPNDQLGAILIEQGKITQEQLDDVTSKLGTNTLVKMLAESGYVNQRELSEAARVKVERILSDVIAYTSGSFEFEDGVLPKGAVDLKLSTEKLILSAVKRISDRSFALRHLDSLQIVLAPTAQLAKKIDELRPETADLPDRLDGRRTLKEAAALTHLEEFEAAKVACALLFLGLAQRSDGTEEAAAAPGEEIDLGGTVQVAVGDGGLGHATGLPPPAREDTEAPFFTDESAAGATPSFPPPDDSAFKITPPPHPDEGFKQPEPFAPSSDETTAFSVPGPETYGLPPEPPPVPDYASASGPPPKPSYSEAPSAPARTPIPPYREPPPAPAALPPPFPAFEDAAPPPTVASRPSKEDLAALDALLNPSASRGPAQPLTPARSERWEPQFRPSTPSTGPRRAAARRRGGSSAVLYLLAAVVLALGGAGAWYYLNLMQPPSPLTARASTPPAETAPSPVASPVAGSTPTPAPVSVASTAPSVAPSQETVPPAASPEPTTAAPGGAAPAEARSLLQRGAFPRAASEFATNLKSARGSFSVQILVACSTETVQKAVDNVPSEELFILPVNYRGRSCYRLCWGVFDSEATAASAAQTLPEYFVRGGASPKAAPLASLLP